VLAAALTGLVAAGCGDTGPSSPAIAATPGPSSTPGLSSTPGSSSTGTATSGAARPIPSSRTPSAVRSPAGTAPAASAPSGPAAPAAMAARATVPVLCWHQLRTPTRRDSAYSRQLLVCPPATFRDQLDALQATGHTTIGPDQYLAHLRDGGALPPRPVVLSFDDSQGTQMAVALPELQRRRMTATFFVMTVVLGRPNWMTRDDVRRLSDAGMTVGAHTWDHHRADRYRGTDWQVQLVRPRAELEKILGHPVVHFAYPYGAWDTADFAHLAAAGYQSAYQLDTDPVDRHYPELTLRRQLVDSGWTGRTLVDRLRRVS